MKPTDAASRSSSGCLTVLATVMVAVVGINLLGYLIAGDSPGYSSAQGGASLYFMLSVVAAPFAAVAGAVVTALLRRRKSRRL